MNLFRHNKESKTSNSAQADQTGLAEMVVKNIHEGIIITDKVGVVCLINSAAVTMVGLSSADSAIGLNYLSIFKLESKEGRELSETENPVIHAMKSGQPLDKFIGRLVTDSPEKRPPVAVSIVIADGLAQHRIIIFRDVTKELEEEGEQTEFISTASHEMRTPVASIEGYLSLALNPQTATIDERARGYINAAHASSKHLGKLFQDLLDITKLEDGKIRPNFTPEEMISLIESLSKEHAPVAAQSKINFRFGSNEDDSFAQSHHVGQVVYGYVDVNFMREIMDNLIGNACKYTPAGGSIYINVRGDGDRVLINVTDTGIGISSSDLDHIFQKFYRADNSDTRTIGGTGLGLYIVKQRTEAMGGRVWAESAFGEGTTFYVSLPRLTTDEYEKRMIVVRNQEMQKRMMQPQSQEPSISPQSLTAQLQPTGSPMPIQSAGSVIQTQPVVSTQAQPEITPMPAPSAPVQPQPTPSPAPAAEVPAPTSSTTSTPPETTPASPQPVAKPDIQSESVTIPHTFDSSQFASTQSDSSQPPTSPPPQPNITSPTNPNPQPINTNLNGGTQ